MKTLKVIVGVWVVLATTTAVAQESPRSAVMTAQRAGPTPPPRTISKTHQPVGTPHKVSSFAPHPTSKRVFGDPIQAPIVHNAPAPAAKTTPPK